MLSLKSFHAITANGFCEDLSAGAISLAFGDQTPVKYVKGRKDTKTLSQAAGFALAALEACGGDDGEDWEKGLFVSAPAPAATDKMGFAKALRGDGEDVYKKIGASLDQAMPVTGLIGLPNGIMCFGSRVTGAMGPNTVAVNEGTGCHQVLAAALRHARNGTITKAVVCGYAQPNLPTNRCQYAALGLIGPDLGQNHGESKLTDSAVSVEFEVGSGAVEVHDAFLFNDTARAVERLQAIGWNPEAIDIVFTPSIPGGKSAAMEIGTSGATHLCVYDYWGYQSEASGLIELGLLAQAVRQQSPEILKKFLVNENSAILMEQGRKFLVLCRSVFGQQSCIAGRLGA